MATISTNLLSLSTQQHQMRAQNQLSKAIERLSTGQRINAASDDAAGQAKANRMTANINADRQIGRGINDGISLAQTAEGGLDGINGLLQRARELAVQSANGTLSDDDRAAINREFFTLRDEIDRIAAGTEIFGKTPLAGEPELTGTPLGNTPHVVDVFDDGSQSYSSGVKAIAYVPAGTTNFQLTINSYNQDDDLQVFTADGKHLVGTPLEGATADYTWSHNGVTDRATATSQLLTEADGFDSGATYDDSNFVDATGSYNSGGAVTNTYNGMTITYTGDGDRTAATTDGEFNNGRLNGSEASQTVERIRVDTVSENLLLFVSGEGSFTANATWDTLPETQYANGETPFNTDTEIVMNADYGQALDTLTIESTPADSEALGIAGTALDPIEKAREALAELDSAMLTVDGYRSQYGAIQNRLEGAMDAAANRATITEAARSRIMDADYAVETSNMTRAQIVSQASNAMLAQANQTPEAMLSLLR
ncbi:flagellin [Larsenimonas suaedae]|uniref:Flagellin n=1 Tax=Larsenimonas suaedae TaxID=1851019 RepID=A0ABU1GVK9_9GAMM|nr:flagellin [Larsenimonas suaedae]MCM2971915.1 hypothetical protein [Larsenimonas suaedae]MDR5895467.1 flagellin [Larsenimonas suaedae]